MNEAIGLYGLSGEEFFRAFPFVIALDEQLQIHAVGPSMEKVLDGDIIGQDLLQIFDVLRPPINMLSLTAQQLCNKLLILKTRRDSGLRFRGALYRGASSVSGQKMWVLLSSPVFSNSRELFDAGIKLRDLAPYDGTADIMLAHQSAQMSRSDAQKLEVAKMQVAEQLFKVNMLLNNAGEGFLSFGSDLLIDSGYSLECLRLFQRDEIGGSIIDLIREFDRSAADLMEKTFSSVLRNDVRDNLVETYLSLLPSYMMFYDRFCEIKYRWVIGDNPGADRKIMMILKDQTEQKEAEDRFKKEMHRLELIVFALANRDEFLQVWNGFYHAISEKIPFLLDGLHVVGESPEDRLSEIYRLIHTYKGLLYQSCCFSLGDQLHEVESKLALIKKDDENGISLAVEAVSSAAIMAAFQETKDILVTHLSDSFFIDDGLYQISEPELAEIERLIKARAIDVDLILRRLNRVRYESFDKLIRPHVAFLTQAARSRGLALRSIDIEGDEVYIDPTKYRHLIHCLAHLFRNALDHGFDTAEERFAANKPEQVNFSCSASYVANQIHIVIRDDGRGIATDVLKSRAVEKGLVSHQAVEAMSHEEALQLVFVDGLSSVETVSHTSGRGVGMAALLEEVTLLNGHVTVESQKGEGTCWTIVVPAA